MHKTARWNRNRSGLVVPAKGSAHGAGTARRGMQARGRTARAVVVDEVGVVDLPIPNPTKCYRNPRRKRHHKSPAHRPHNSGQQDPLTDTERSHVARPSMASVLNLVLWFSLFCAPATWSKPNVCTLLQCEPIRGLVSSAKAAHRISGWQQARHTNLTALRWTWLLRRCLVDKSSDKSMLL